jgi:ribosomal protein S17
MNMFRKTATVLLTAMAAVALGASAADTPKPQKVSETASLTATITAINPTTREITFKGPKGEVETLVASDEVKRFSELKVGDQVTVTYTVSLAVRLAKPDEAAAAASADLSRSKGPRPGGAAKAETTIVVTLENIDATVPSVTFKTATGELRTVHVRDPKNLVGYKVGDKVAITYTESMAIAVSAPAKK